MPKTPEQSREWLFSYGTLQLEPVQRATFGRLLPGHADDLVGYVIDQVAIDDPAVVATSGKTHHPIVRFTGRAGDSVSGMVFALTVEELQQADRYEVAAYVRIATVLRSGRRAWVYVDNRFAPPAG